MVILKSGSPAEVQRNPVTAPDKADLLQVLQKHFSISSLTVPPHRLLRQGQVPTVASEVSYDQAPRHAKS